MTYTVSIRIDVEGEGINSGSDAVAYVEDKLPEDEAFELVSIEM